MTSLPQTTQKKLGLAIDLDSCVGCHACVVNCKEWNSSSELGAPLSDQDAYGANPQGTFLNRVHSFEVTPQAQASSGCGAQAAEAQTVYMPKSCLHCEDAPCVTVCPTGASFKRSEDGIVLVNEDDCMGCGLCAWACPYGARELDFLAGVMKKCTLCVDRIYDEALEPEDRVPACVRTCPTGARHFGDFADPNSKVSQLAKERGAEPLFASQGTKPVNRYLPPRPKNQVTSSSAAQVSPQAVAQDSKGFLSWLDKTLEKF